MMGSKNKKIITVSTREATLKRHLRRHLKALGFRKDEDGALTPAGTGKDVIRTIHSSQREARIIDSEKFTSARYSKLIPYFAHGTEVNAAKISPVLQRVSGNTWEGDLFRLASLTWSVPVSNGFGRRLRYLVWDEHNGKLMGIIAIGDPVFNLSVRDTLIDWDVAARGERLVNIMDAYVLGALPPYNMLLGGKLVACLVRSRDIYNDFTKAYGKTTGIISQQEKKARLLVVTTSSSMGRSSVYNRLKLGGVEYFKPIGYTGGWGHFHIPDTMFEDLRNYVREIGHTYADMHEFGNGPNWRMRTMRVALTALGFKEDMLRHGIKREVFISRLAENAFKILQSGKGRPDLSSLLRAEDVAKLAVERWMLPRSQRMPEYKAWNRDDIATLLAKQRSAPLSLQSSRTPRSRAGR